jgi:uncharacterized protein (TIGR00369 family)
MTLLLIMAEHGRVLFEAVPAEKFLNPLGTIHGGWISTLLDSAMGCAVHCMLKPGHGFTTVDMTVSFVRAVLPTSGKLICEGKIIHSGGRIATAEGCVTDVAGKLIAHGTETCMILKAPVEGSVWNGPAVLPAIPPRRGVDQEQGARHASLLQRHRRRRRHRHRQNTFHLVGLNSPGAIILRLKLSRTQLEAKLANLPPCLVVMEARAGAIRGLKHTRRSNASLA